VSSEDGTGGERGTEGDEVGLRLVREEKDGRRGSLQLLDCILQLLKRCAEYVFVTIFLVPSRYIFAFSGQNHTHARVNSRPNKDVGLRLQPF
jgi:hypothetical protein